MENRIEKNNILKEVNELFSIDTHFLGTLKDDVLRDIEYYNNIIEVIIFLWQQNAGLCYKSILNTKFESILIEAMKPNIEDKTFFKGLYSCFKKDINPLRLIESMSDDYLVAKNFALYRRNSVISGRLDTGCILHIKPKFILPAYQISSVDNEREYLAYDFQVIKIEEVHSENKLTKEKENENNKRKLHLYP